LQRGSPANKQPFQVERIFFSDELVVAGLNLFEKWLKEGRISGAGMDQAGHFLASQGSCPEAPGRRTNPECAGHTGNFDKPATRNSHRFLLPNTLVPAYRAAARTGSKPADGRQLL
jgi:hypothetical protein